MNRLSALLILICSASLLGFSQNQTEFPNTLRGDFDKMLKESNRYQDFKVVKRVKLDAFIRQVEDTLALRADEMKREVQAAEELRAQLASLRTENENLESEVTRLNDEKDGIQTLGMNMDKGSFASMMWFLVIALAAVGVFLVLRLRTNSSAQSRIKKHLSDLEDELGSTKKKALEKEQELKREMQDYINQLEALKPPR